MSEPEVVTMRCPRCRHRFRVLADEVYCYSCPRCGYGDQPVPPTEESEEEDMPATRPTPEEDAEQAVRLLVRLINDRDDDRTLQFVLALAREHRTNQQQVTRMMLEWFACLSTLGVFQFDDRNAHSVKVAKMIREHLEQEWGSAWTHMPLI